MSQNLTHNPHNYWLILYQFFVFTQNLKQSLGTIAHYTITQLSETPISLPDIEEQIKVGEYFESLDRLITLHQRQYQKLFQ